MRSYVWLLSVAGVAAQTVPAPLLPPQTQPWLELAEVLASVDKHYPPLLAVIQDRMIAAGDVLSAEGRFDLSLKSDYAGDYLGYLRNNTYRAGVEQATAIQGMSYFANWRYGHGLFAPWDGARLTDSLGEYTVGFRLPTLRDRAIDFRRAELQKAVLGRRVADLGVDQQRILILQFAARAYWDWVASGRRLDLARNILKVAVDRDILLREAADAGQIPRVEVTDNERAILTRRAQVVESQRGLELTAIEMSLFYRDAAGEPRLAEPGQLPPAFPAIREVTEQRLAEDIELALRRRPEIQRFAVQRSQVEVDRQLALNQLLPNIDLVLKYSRSTGERIVRRGPDELLGSIIFDLPLQRRHARGRDVAAVARIEQFDQRERFARDRVMAEVRDAYSALRAAYERSVILRREVEVATELETIERIKFDAGEGNQFLVNLREHATFDTAVREVSALNDYFRAQALYEFAIAEALTRKP
jgi:outer membrane protein TolC